MAKCKTIDEIHVLEQINLQAVTAVKVSTDFSVFFFFAGKPSLNCEGFSLDSTLGWVWCGFEKEKETMSGTIVEK